MQSPNKILIDGPAWVGDMIMAQTLFKLLKKKYPKAEIDVIAPAFTKPLLDRMPEINSSHQLPVGHGELSLRKRYRVAKTLRQHKYDWAILLRNSWKSGLIPYWAQIPQRTGWLGEKRYGLLNDWRKLDKSRYPLMIERFIALGLLPDETLPTTQAWPKLKTSMADSQQAMQKLALNATTPILALCPGAEFGPSKCWPLEYYAEVAKHWLSLGKQVWLFGSTKDIDAAEKINALCDNQCVNLAGKTSLAEAIDLLALADCVVSNDSGLMHVAAALQRDLIVPYGSTSAAFTPPLAERVHILSENLACSPCFKRTCPLGHHRCMLDLKPEKVIKVMAARYAHCG